MNPIYDQEVVYAKGCTSIEQLNQLTSLSNRSNDNFKMGFFYNPPDDHQNYHITCEEVSVSFELVYQLTNDTDDNDRAYNYVQPDSYKFIDKTLHENMVHDNFNDETMNGPPFRNTTNGDYTQDYKNNSSLFNPNNDNIQQGV
ncbi:unnamed protein product [Rhizophagus irregularis]|nr:unnamed protein product [Rhizophagus irregularis]